MKHPEDMLASVPPPNGHQVQIVAEYHCPTCAALGYLGSTIDRYEEALRKIGEAADNALHGESPPPSIDVCASILGVARDALGEP